MKIHVFLLGLISIVCVVTAAKAQEDGLYAPPPPPGSAFVRFVNGGAQAGTPEIGGKPCPGVEPGGAGDYLAAPGGETPLTWGGGGAKAALKSGAHYAAVLHDGKLSVLEEPAYDPKLKAQIVLLNLTGEKGISLKSGAVTILDNVSPGALAARAVNALKVGFTVSAGPRKIADLAPVPLERGGSYAVVVYIAEDGHPRATLHESAQP